MAQRYLKRAERDHYAEQLRLSAGDSAQKPVQLDEESDKGLKNNTVGKKVRE